jgi:hypothetical protein
MTDAYHDVLVAFHNISHVNHQCLTFVICEWFVNGLQCFAYFYMLIMVAMVGLLPHVATKVFAGSSTRRNVLPRDRLKVYAAAIQAGIRYDPMPSEGCMVGSWLDHGWITSDLNVSSKHSAGRKPGKDVSKVAPMQNGSATAM